MFESVHVKADSLGKAALARIMCEKLTERESSIVTEELLRAAAQTDHRIAVDLSRVLFVASAGVGCIISVNKTCMENKGKLAVFGVNDDLMKLLKLTKLHKIFVVAKDEHAAVKAVT